MEAEKGKSNGNGTECSEGLHCLKSDGIGSDVARWILEPSEGFRTYKRRKRVKSSADSKSEDNGRAFAEEESQTVQQPMKEPPGVAFVNEKPCEEINSPMDHSDVCSQRPWNFFLEHMYQSLSDEKDSLQKCIQDMLQSCPELGSKSRDKDPDGNMQRSNSAAQNTLNGFQKETNRIPDVSPNGRLDSSSLHKTTEMCRHAWFNILLSNEFTSLCKLFSENFQGIKTERVFDLKLMNSRIKDGAYDHSPTLFLRDIQQVWEKIQGIGNEMISLAKDLSDMSRSCYDNQVQFCALGSDSHTNQGEDYCAYRVCTCRRCGDKADGRNCLVCDSCEEMYHVSCIEPAVEQIPPKSWYCSSCTTSGIRLPHENCVVCEKLNAPKTNIRGVGNDSSCTEDETPNEFGENSNEVLELSIRSTSSGVCKICGCQILDGEKSLICSHGFCPSKHYHVRCLTRKQVKSYGPRWYCPSCLCRSCLIDKDDDDVVLCDGCDHAYHIYCTEPPMARVPIGSWFCRSCEAKLEGIRNAKKAYEKYEKKQKKKVNERFKAFGVFGNQWSSGSCMELDNGGGMEMLLTAVNTLNNFQEDMAG